MSGQQAEQHLERLVEERRQLRRHDVVAALAQHQSGDVISSYGPTELWVEHGGKPPAPGGPSLHSDHAGSGGYGQG